MFSALDLKFWKEKEGLSTRKYLDILEGSRGGWCLGKAGKPANAAIFSRGPDLCNVEISCHNGRSLGLTWRLATITVVVVVTAASNGSSSWS